MKKHIIALAGLLAGAMMVTSCSQARLDDVEQLGAIEVDKTYAEADDATAQQLIANVYVTVKYLMMGDWGVHYIATTSAKTAECWPGGSGPNDGTDYHRMSAMIDDSENNAYKEMYTRFYKIMYKCNRIVDQLNDGSDERKRVIAEAKAWRAWAMMRLTQLWGSAPWVEHVLDGDTYSFYPGNSDPEDQGGLLRLYGAGLYVAERLRERQDRIGQGHQLGQVRTLDQDRDHGSVELRREYGACQIEQCGYVEGRQ